MVKCRGWQEEEEEAASTAVSVSSGCWRAGGGGPLWRGVEAQCEEVWRLLTNHTKNVLLNISY